MLQDFYLIEKLTKVVSERIPERHVHAKGALAKGFFNCTNPDIAKYTKANFI